VRSSCDASATKRRSLRSDASRARNADSIGAQHRVERAPEAPDLRLLVRALDPARQVARGDRLGRRLDLAQRTQTESDDPEAETPDGDEHGPGRQQLDQRQAVQRPVHSGERGGDHEHAAGLLRLDRRADPVAPTSRARHHREVRRPVAVALGRVSRNRYSDSSFGALP
jgi:hypothetical protein